MGIHCVDRPTCQCCVHVYGMLNRSNHDNDGHLQIFELNFLLPAPRWAIFWIDLCIILCLMSIPWPISLSLCSLMTYLIYACLSIVASLAAFDWSPTDTPCSMCMYPSTMVPTESCLWFRTLTLLWTRTSFGGLKFLAHTHGKHVRRQVNNKDMLQAVVVSDQSKYSAYHRTWELTASAKTHRVAWMPISHGPCLKLLPKSLMRENLKDLDRKPKGANHNRPVHFWLFTCWAFPLYRFTNKLLF